MNLILLLKRMVERIIKHPKRLNNFLKHKIKMTHIVCQKRKTVNEILEYRISRTRGDVLRLENFGYKVYSQSDEDGILAEIFRRIGTTNQIFVEFGAETGWENNSHLLLERGWTGLWMEGNPNSATSLRRDFHEEISKGRLIFLETYVNNDNINCLIKQSGIHGEIDILSIDIDSLDYYVFEAIDIISPRVVCIEHNHSFLPGQHWVMPYDLSYHWDHTSGVADYGASITALLQLANRKGYQLVGCGLYSANGFYVRDDLVDPDKFRGPFTAENFFNPLIAEMVFKFPRGVEVFRRQL